MGAYWRTFYKLTKEVRMAGKFNWRAFIAEVLQIAPAIVKAVEVDKVAFSHEDKTTAAAQATLQASQLAAAVDPADAATIDAAAEVTSGLITALKAPPPSA
jgi:hypothetical protein